MMHSTITRAKVVLSAIYTYAKDNALHSSLKYLTLLQFKQQHHPIPNRAILQE